MFCFIRLYLINKVQFRVLTLTIEHMFGTSGRPIADGATPHIILSIKKTEVRVGHARPPPSGSSHNL